MILLASEWKLQLYFYDMIFWVMVFFLSYPLVGGGVEPVLFGGDIPPPPDETSNDNIGDATLAAHMRHVQHSRNTRTIASPTTCPANQ